MQAFALTTRRLALAALAASALTFGITTAARAQETVNIGFTGPLSGGAALYGKNVTDGMQLAINEINAKGLEIAGKKVKLQLVALDDQYAPAQSAVNARRLVQQSKTAAIFVPHSGGIYALQAFNQQGPAPFLLMAYSSVPKITETGNKLTVRIPPLITGYIEPFSRYEQRRFGKKVGLLPGDHEYAKTWTELFKPVWTKLGGQIVADNPMSYNKSADFYSGVSRVLAAKPDVLFVGGASEPTGLVIKQARELGFKGGFLIMDQAKLDEIAKITGGLAALEGSVGVLPLTADTSPGIRAFIATYAKAYGADHTPTSEAAYNYTMVYALADAMKRAGTASDPKAIYAQMDAAIKALPPSINTGMFKGLEADGGVQTEPIAAVVEDGKIKPVKLTDLK
ncbi:MAG: ABC transporter substrate-binding protein [Burkholderiaceae bacterium]|jgi:branched-chain amino acid transport system substrate-binding protein|nr:ABC transporter substrate-binding protein [Burkholderiaceae bacterium]